MYPSADQTRPGPSQATKINLFARIVDFFKLMKCMFEGFWLYPSLVLTQSLMKPFPIHDYIKQF